MKASALQNLEITPEDAGNSAGDDFDSSVTTDTEDVDGSTRRKRRTYRRALRQALPSRETTEVRGLPPGLPSYVDWRERGVVTSVKDQGECECCLVFWFMFMFLSDVFKKCMCTLHVK